VKVVVVGGGSTYTPELIEGFADRDAALHVEDLVLLDVDAERLAVVGGLARRMLERRGWPGRLTLTTGQDGAFDGADFVLLQIRVGGQATRFVDETLPHRFGCIGQETTGPGGFAKALRTVPVVLDIAEAATRRAAPGAWIIDFTNPVGIVTQALVDGGFRAIGLCNVAIGMQRTFAQRFGVEPGRVELEHVGLNHLSWERAIRVDGKDVLPGMLETDGAWLADMVSLPEELVQALRAVPSYYLRYFYMTDVVLAEQLAGKSRAEDVMAIERDLLERYRDPELAEKPKQLEERGGAFYSEAAVQHVDLRPRQRRHEALHEGAVGLVVQPLRLRGDRAEDQRALAGAGDACEDRQPAFRELDADVLEVVHTRAVHADQVVAVGIVRGLAHLVCLHL
jgi:6-phospho-beta-glucosidase